MLLTAATAAQGSNPLLAIAVVLFGGGTIAAIVTGAFTLAGRRPTRLDELIAIVDAQRKRIDDLEDDVEQCEIGRAEDRLRFRQEIDELRLEVTALRTQGGTP